MNLRTLVVAITVACYIGIQTPASAAVISTGEHLAAEQRALHLARIDAVVNRVDVQARLESLGVDPDAAAVRAASLSDEELAQVSAQMDQLPAGGDSALAVIGVVFLVLLILELTGVTNIFNRI